MKYQTRKKVYRVSMKEGIRLVKPVNGEKHFNEPSWSHGFTHFADPKTGKKVGFSGIQWFEDNAVLVD